ncbi:nucleosidase [Corynebacterium phocae]|uniref:Nucleosidase n=1 Tax=Corynebacterium phocae TaxID=161895 RepID=A0A1L7D5D0_9CORY|nr:nucleosidase [Corynebacterium phocae]APT93349.1 nucleosidase [Corynebacterium phocae]KAA8721685.1 nucleosidase [Corynebacterium phocae]
MSQEKILFVAAVDAEVKHLPSDAELLITGIGTVNAAMKVSEYLAAARERGQLPDRVVNLGTVGALRDGLDGVFEISTVIKHDWNLLIESDIHRYLLPEVIELETTGQLPRQGLATGDTFVTDTQLRNRLAEESGLCDMEGYAIAAACQHFGVPLTMLKQVSDPANEETVGQWANALDRAAFELDQAAKKLGFLPH